MHEAVEPAMREVLDQFNDALFWHGLEDTPGAESVLPGRPRPWDAELLLWCPPDGVPHLARWWRHASPRLEVLREPFARHAAKPNGYFPTFESFAEFLASGGTWSPRLSAGAGASSACAADRRLRSFTPMPAPTAASR